MLRFFAISTGAAALLTTAAFAQAPEAAPFEEEAAEGEPPVAAASELDSLNQGAEEEFPDIEAKQIRKPVSVTVRALDKITARYKDLTAKIGEPVKFGSLEILPRYCDKRPPEEFPETTAFLEVFDRDLARSRSAASVAVQAEEPAKKAKKGPKPSAAAPLPAQASAAEMPTALDEDRIFSGWMFASTPALNPLEHAVYDVWVIDCKTVVVSN
jgi:hypothetical protein